MNAFLCLFLRSFIDADRNEKKGLSSPRKLILVNFKVNEVLMKVLVMAWWRACFEKLCSGKSRGSLETFGSNHRLGQVCLAALGNNGSVSWMDFRRHGTGRTLPGTCWRTNSPGAAIAVGKKEARRTLHPLPLRNQQLSRLLKASSSSSSSLSHQ